AGLLSSTAVTVTDRLCTFVPPLPSSAVTCTRYTLSALASVGTSKSGAVTNVSTPADVALDLIASAPPASENATVCSGRSPSVAVTVVTPVVFSCSPTRRSSDLAGLLSSTAVTVTDRLCTFVPPLPSSAVTCTRYTLSALASVGTSKSGAVTNVSTPADVMLNLVASEQHAIEHHTRCAGRSPSLAV